MNNGVDEAFCGHYSHEDTFFVKYSRSRGVTFREADVLVDCTAEDARPGAFYFLDRDTGTNERSSRKIIIPREC